MYLFDINFTDRVEYTGTPYSFLKDTFIPIIVPIGCVILGYYLNIIYDYFKKRRLAKQAGEALLNELLLIDKLIPFQVKDFKEYSNNLRTAKFEDTSKNKFPIA